MTKLPTASSDTMNWEVAKNYRNSIIEECARVAENWDFQSKDPVTGDSIADAIRAKKDKP